MRRGRPLTSQTAFGGQLPYKGSLVRPAVRFDHSPFEHNGRLLRAIRHKFRLFTEFAAVRPLGVPYGIAYRRWYRTRSQAAKKYTASGLVRRGRPLTSQTAFGGQLPYKGSLGRPVARFHHSPFEYNGRLLRATNHEPRATIFSTRRGSLEAACDLRGRQVPTSMNDERPTMNGDLRGRQAP